MPAPRSLPIEIRERLARAEAILASTLDPIVTITATGTIIEASRSIERVFGWSPAEIIGRNIAVLMPEPHRSRHDDYLHRYRETGRTNILGRTRELSGVHRDGRIFPIEISVALVEVEGGAEPLFTGIIHDATQRREAERALAAHRARLEELVRMRTRQLETTHDQLRSADRLAAIGTLAAGLGHDMNNLLLPLRCRLDALDTLLLDPLAQEHLGAIRRSAEYLQHLSDGLHLLSLDPEDATASPETTDVATWWAQAGMLLSRAVPREVQFECVIPDGLHRLRMPSHRLTQAILNLIVNAGEAVEPGGHVRLEVVALPGYVELAVRDDGCGMSPEVLKRALEPFYTTKKRGLGTGLGLSLAHGVAAAAGGSLTIESEPGKGTTIRIRIPTVPPLAERESTGDTGAPVLRIALDDPRRRSLVAAIARAVGFRPATDSEIDNADALVCDRAAGARGRDPATTIVLGASGGPDPDDFEALRASLISLADRLAGASA